MKIHLVLTLLFFLNLKAQVAIYFIYGSKPAKGFDNVQRKWFGGIKGGHVGIGNSKDSILHFLLKGKFHLFQDKSIRGKFKLNKEVDFVRIFQKKDSIKYIRIEIPNVKISDTLYSQYLHQSPYDYAFFGMRCAASTAEILNQLKVLNCSKRPWMRYFYPALLRKKLLRKARKNNWVISYHKGTYQRKWEKGRRW